MAVNVVEAAVGLNSYIRRRDAHYDFIPEDQKRERRKQRSEFVRTLQCSRLSLCPANEAGVLRRRFWEALSMGRIPVVIDDELDLSRWDSFCLIVPESRVLELPEILAEYISANTDVGLRYRGVLAREAWERINENSDHHSGV
jgi:hypothetical protein